MYKFLNKYFYFLLQLESDYNHQNEDKIDIIYSEWPKVSEAIITETIERGLLPKNDQIKGN